MKIATLLLLCSVFAGCNEHAVDAKAEGEKLMETSREWSKTAATGDMDKTLSYWADDAVVMSPGQPALKGKDAIRGMMESTSKIPGFRISWEPISVSVSKSGDMAYMIEKNQVTVNDSTGRPVTEYNKSVTIWRKEADGSWKNIVDMWNADPSQIK
ncbi:MAG TPA: SgcJ/EcaC family oxidoreductase [Ferruginibacter sp.]|nr:SgcJ/EcaC family oxidoreductase [Ferruginibacter sp.]